MKLLRRLIFLTLMVLAVYVVSRWHDPQFRAYAYGFQMLKGDRYYSRLQLWYTLARADDWQDADLIEQKYLDSADTAAYKALNQPEELKKLVNSLAIKPNKSVEDWLELARIQSLLGKSKEASASITKAHELDPVREDITKLYYQLVK